MKSVVEYFYETYGFVIQHSQWPCLQVGNQQRPNYLPMEVCMHAHTHKHILIYKYTISTHMYVCIYHTSWW